MSEVQGVVQQLRLTYRRSAPAVWKALYRRTRGTRPTGPWSCARCPEEVVLWDGDRPVSFMGTLERRVTINGQPNLIGGLGYGATAPDWERRGCLRRVVAHALDLFTEQGRDWVLLTCLDALVPFYRDKLGWMQVGASPIWMDQPGGRTQVPPEVAVMAYWLDNDIAHPAPTITQLDLEGLPW